MNKATFIKMCSSSGYASTSVAKEYAEGRDLFNDEDFIKVSRFAERKNNSRQQFGSEKWPVGTIIPAGTSGHPDTLAPGSRSTKDKKWD